MEDEKSEQTEADIEEQKIRYGHSIETIFRLSEPRIIKIGTWKNGMPYGWVFEGMTAIEVFENTQRQEFHDINIDTISGFHTDQFCEDINGFDHIGIGPLILVDDGRVLIGNLEIVEWTKERQKSIMGL